MKTLKRKITESQLKEILKETVNDVLNRIGVINEKAVPLRTYRARVDALRFQLAENWCLCKWCQIFNSECENFALWITELKTCIDNLKFLDIKNGIDKRRTLTRMLIDDYDYDETNMIVRIINDRFDIENIKDNTQREKVASEFANGIRSLIEVISVDAISTNSYIQNTFLLLPKIRKVGV
jgi:hypothetical protein